jgi:hypothetical protein
MLSYKCNFRRYASVYVNAPVKEPLLITWSRPIANQKSSFFETDGSSIVKIPIQIQIQNCIMHSDNKLNDYYYGCH